MDIDSEARELFAYTREIRRDLHIHPDLGFEEFRTASIVADELAKAKLAVKKNVGRTGVVGVLEGKFPGPTVLLRFDMDALPIEEDTGVEYASRNPGKMHACGHDGHVAIGLTVAKLLAKYRDSLTGNYKLIFQPAEEGLGGAEEMIREGILGDPKPDFALGLHLWNEKLVGWCGVTDGPFMAGADLFTINISGKGGHGALPENTIDPVVTAAHLITALQTIVSRNVSPQKVAVISVTRVIAGTAYNIIPSEAILHGTIRTFDSEIRNQVHDRIGSIVKGVCEGLGCSASVKITKLTPAVVNDSRATDCVRKAISESKYNIFQDNHYQSMVSEDMALILEEIPGCFFFVGSGFEDTSKNYGHHHP